jgi:hypothetical protein
MIIFCLLLSFALKAAAKESQPFADMAPTVLKKNPNEIHTDIPAQQLFNSILLLYFILLNPLKIFTIYSY